MKDVSIVIPNWNGFENLKKNLPFVMKVKEVKEVIVVDDASWDQSVGLIKINFPRIKLIERKHNSGFAATVNLGVANAKGQIVFLLNSDACPSQDSVIKALPHFDNQDIFSVSCNTGGNWSWIKFRKGFLWHYSMPSSDGQVRSTHQTLWASGGSGLFRKDIWDKLGGLDELFSPFYEEDTDLGYRATKRGYINIWEINSKVEHYKTPGVIAQHFSASFISQVASRNQLIFIWKNLTDRKLMFLHISYLILYCLTHPRYILIVLRALVKLPQIIRYRAIEERLSRLSDKEILAMYL